MELILMASLKKTLFGSDDNVQTQFVQLAHKPKGNTIYFDSTISEHLLIINTTKDLFFDLENKENPKCKYELKANQDNFILFYKKEYLSGGDESYSDLVNDWFDIKLNKGFIIRICKECSVNNELDGQTIDNYSRFLTVRQVCKEKGVKFAGRFWFDCKHFICDHPEYYLPKPK
jgi:hypothetical protein